jgi:hypothetical protein
LSSTANPVYSEPSLKIYNAIVLRYKAPGPHRLLGGA